MRVLKLTNTTYDYRRRYKLIRRILGLRRILALMAIGIAMGAVAMNVVRTVWPDVFGQAAAGTHPFTALCILFAGVGLYQFKVGKKRSKWLYLAAIVLLLTLVGISLEIISPQWRHFTGGGVCELVFDPVAPYVTRHVRPSAALTLALILASALARRMSARVGMLLAVLAFVEILSILVTISLERGLHSHNMQLGTFAALLPLSLSMLTIYAHRPMGRLLFLADGIGRRTRILTLTSVILSWLAGYIIQSRAPVDDAAQHFNSYVISALIVAMVLVVLFSGIVQVRADAARRRAERRLMEMVHIDDLTGVRSRRSGDDMLEARWRDYWAGNIGAGIILMDLDRFKEINDRFGHEVGDAVLAQVGVALGPHLRRDDLLCRWGGEELLMVVPVTSAGDLAVVGERMRKAVSRIELPGQGEGENDLTVSASFGMSWFQAGDSSRHDAIRRADIALFKAKRAGRDCAVVYNPIFHRRAG